MNNIINFDKFSHALSEDAEDIRKKLDSFGVCVIVFNKDEESGKVGIEYEKWHTITNEINTGDMLRVLWTAFNMAIEDVERGER